MKARGCYYDFKNSADTASKLLESVPYHPLNSCNNKPQPTLCDAAAAAVCRRFISALQQMFIPWYSESRTARRLIILSLTNNTPQILRI